jgi:hypothetical protein
MCSPGCSSNGDAELARSYETSCTRLSIESPLLIHLAAVDFDTLSTAAASRTVIAVADGV